MQPSTSRDNNREREEFKIRVIEGRSSSTILMTSNVGAGSSVQLFFDDVRMNFFASPVERGVKSYDGK